MTAQVQEALIPDHLVALAAGNDRRRLSYTHSRGTPSNHSKARACPSRNDSIVMSNEKNAVCAPEYGRLATSA